MQLLGLSVHLRFTDVVCDVALHMALKGLCHFAVYVTHMYNSSAKRTFSEGQRTIAIIVALHLTLNDGLRHFAQSVCHLHVKFFGLTRLLLAPS